MENVEDFVAYDVAATTELQSHIDSSRKRLKAKGSLGAEFWSQAKEITEQELRFHKLKHKRSFHEFVSTGGKKESWRDNQEARTLREEKKSLELRLRCVERQMKTLLTPVDNGMIHISRRWFMELFTAAPTSKGGVAAGDVAGQGQRDGGQQSSFRKKIIEFYGSAGGVEAPGEFWCPIMAEFLPKDQMGAAHIFPYSAGQEAMDNLFGRIKGRSEMFEPENGLLISKVAEKNISLGFMAIVPNIPDGPTKEEQAEWNDAKIKSYKIEVINVKAKGAQLRMPPLWNDSDGNRLHWSSQHGKVLQFKNDFRPRARYLWWQWAISHLRKIWQDLSEHQVPEFKQHNQPYWGTVGSYVRSGPLSALAEEMGANFDNLMDAAMSPEDEAEGGREVGIDDGIGALLTAEYQLTQTRPGDDEEEEDVPGTDEEDENEDEEIVV